MKNFHLYFVVVYFLCQSGIGLSQSNYEIIYGSAQWHEIVSDVEECEPNRLLITGFKCIPNSNRYSGFLLEINEIGELTDEYLFNHPDSSFFPIHMIEISDSIYVFGQKFVHLNDEKKFIWSFILDTALNIIKSTSYSLPASILDFGIQSVKFYDGNFILLMNVTTQEEPQFSDIGFFITNKNLDSISSMIDFREGNQLAFDFLKSMPTKYYKIFGRGNYPETYPFYSQIIKFDSNFNFISVDSIPWKLTDQFSAVQFKDSCYLLTGKKPVTNPPKFNVGLINLSNTDELIWKEQFGKTGDTNNYPGVSNNLSFIYANYIYLGGTSNFIALQYPWQQVDSWIMLNQFDSNLNLTFQNFYGGDAFYLLRGIQATHDGGCVMYATRFDENTQFEEYDVYIIKVDSTGLLSSTGNYPSIPVQQLAIMPNPAINMVSIRYPDIFGYDYKEIDIYNSQGRLIFETSAKQDLTETSVDVSALPPGLYFVVLKVEGKKVATGKLVKI